MAARVALSPTSVTLMHQHHAAIAAPVALSSTSATLMHQNHAAIV